MIRRPRVVWLLESREPTGAAMMAMRRMRVLRHHHAATALALSAGSRVPQQSPLHSVWSANSLAGEVRIARADIVVTTSAQALASAAPRVTPGARLVHFLHTRPDAALASLEFMPRVPAVSMVVVPPAVHPGRFAEQAGLRADQVVAADDFTLPREALLGTATGTVIVAAGRLAADSAILDLAEGFRRALPQLPGWQLRVLGGGPKLADLRAFTERHGLGSRLLALGPRYDAGLHYLEAGLVVRLESSDVNGLSVLEALAAGVPVLGADDVPAVQRHVAPGLSGWVLHRRDPEAIAEALVEAARGPRAEYAAAARESRAGLLTEPARTELIDVFQTVLDTAPVARVPVAALNAPHRDEP